jgi:hypothetical protein
MLKVSQRGNGFHISIGDHRPVKAYDLEEVQRAVEHYYGAAHQPIPLAKCPFCRAISKERSGERCQT